MSVRENRRNDCHTMQTGKGGLCVVFFLSSFYGLSNHKYLDRNERAHTHRENGAHVIFYLSKISIYSRVYLLHIRYYFWVPAKASLCLHYSVLLPPSSIVEWALMQKLVCVLNSDFWRNSFHYRSTYARLIESLLRSVRMCGIGLNILGVLAHSVCLKCI